MGNIRETMKVAFTMPIRNLRILVPYTLYAILNAPFFYWTINRIGNATSSITFIILLTTLFCSFTILVPPYFNAWLYFLVADIIDKARNSLKEGIIMAKRRYLGFLDLKFSFLSHL